MFGVSNKSSFYIDSYISAKIVGSLIISVKRLSSSFIEKIVLQDNFSSFTFLKQFSVVVCFKESHGFSIKNTGFRGVFRHFPVQFRYFLFLLIFWVSFPIQFRHFPIQFRHFFKNSQNLKKTKNDFNLLFPPHQSTP